MATVTLLPAIDEYQYWADFFEPSAFNVTSKSASTYNYTRADGTRISITGSGFTYDPTAPKDFLGGTIFSITVRNAANVIVLTITGLAYDAVDFYHRVNGFPGEPGDGFAAITQLLLGNDLVNGTDHGDDISAGVQFGNDTINAKGGDDFVKGDPGNDKIDGGTGWDILSYQETIWLRGAFKGITLNTATGVVSDAWGNTDLIKNFEEYRGSSFADKITGKAGDDELFHGLRGADNINGAAGWDQVCYEADQQFGGLKGIIANLTTGKVIDGFGQTDIVAGIEGVRGTKFNDSFIGSALDNWFEGLGGKDTFNGGGGFDIVAFNNIDWNGAVHGVTVNLGTNQVVNDGFNQVEALVSIEGVQGSRFADTLTGNALGNSIRGRAGADTVNGAAGADVVSGDEGNDLVTGGAGADNFRFRTAVGLADQDRLTDFNPAQDTIQLVRDIFSVLALGALPATAFKSGPGGGVKDANDRIIYNTTNGQILYDTDGSGAAAAQVFATLLTKPALTAADFVVI